MPANSDPNNLTGTPPSDTSPSRATGWSRQTKSFIIVTTILFISAVAFATTVQQMKLHFKKLPVDIATYGKPLEQLPRDFGPWHMVAPGDDRLNEDVEHALGTQEYVFRSYLDERVLGKAVIDSIKEMNEHDRQQAIAQYQFRNPTAIVTLAVTYYTGLVDTVAHIPDRCYIADGYEPTSYRTVDWDTPSGKLSVRYINFEDQTGHGNVSKNVAYLFQVNGEYTSDPLGVRRILQNLFQKYGYYAKVELMTQRLDPATAETVMSGFLASAIPEVEKCLPDWKRVQSAAPTNAPAAASDEQ